MRELPKTKASSSLVGLDAAKSAEPTRPLARGALTNSALALAIRAFPKSVQPLRALVSSKLSIFNIPLSSSTALLGVLTNLTHPLTEQQTQLNDHICKAGTTPRTDGLFERNDPNNPTHMTATCLVDIDQLVTVATWRVHPQRSLRPSKYASRG